MDAAIDELTDELDLSVPLAVVRRWAEAARQAGLVDPTAATLATTDADGHPDARVVLLRAIEDDHVRWYTNLRSAKADQLRVQPHAALVLLWPQLSRQIRLRGPVEEVDAADSDRYFAQRPRGSQVAAWASAQSESIADRAALEARFAEAERRFADHETVPRPPHWGGHRLAPDRIEFWAGRPGRLHDRLLVTRRDEAWEVTRLQP